MRTIQETIMRNMCGHRLKTAAKNSSSIGPGHKVGGASSAALPTAAEDRRAAMAAAAEARFQAMPQQ